MKNLSETKGWAEYVRAWKMWKTCSRDGIPTHVDRYQLPFKRLFVVADEEFERDERLGRILQGLEGDGKAKRTNLGLGRRLWRLLLAQIRPQEQVATFVASTQRGGIEQPKLVETSDGTPGTKTASPTHLLPSRCTAVQLIDIILLDAYPHYPQSQEQIPLPVSVRPRTTSATTIVLRL